MTVDVTVKTVEPAPTAVVVATTTWQEFPVMWGPMLDEVWSFLRGPLPGGLVATATHTRPDRRDRRYSSGGVRVEHGERIPAI